MSRPFTMIALAGITLFPFRASAQDSKYAKFWTWFAAESPRLLALDGSNDPLLDSLAGALQRVHPDLTFELGPRVTSGRREFVISADGLRKVFPEVEALAAAAPPLPQWTVIKFRPRRPTLSLLELSGEKFDPDRARFLLVKDAPGKVGIVLFLEHYSKDRHDVFAKAGYLLLDEALGEYDMETRVGAIDFLTADSPYFTRSYPLTTLAADFDAHFASPKK
jgi:hypothetical protein